MNYSEYYRIKKQLYKKHKQIEVLNNQIISINKQLEEHEDNMKYKTKNASK